MASQKMLAQRLRDLELESRAKGHSAATANKLTKERARPIHELVAAAKGGSEAAQKLLDAMRQEVVKRGVE